MCSSLRRLLTALILLPLVARGTLVTTPADEDDGSLGSGAGISLREAVKYSPAGDTITFAPALTGQTIRLTLGEITIANSLTIDGSALPRPITLSADRTGNGKTADDTYVILLTGGSLLMDSFVLTGANCPESSGCITIQSTVTFSLTLNHCTITGNAGYHASALHAFSGSTRPTDSITLLNTTIARNSVVKGAAVVDVAYHQLNVVNSTISQNDAGAIYYRSASTGGTLSISNITISANTSRYPASGLYISHDGINPPGQIQINNTICAGNLPANIYNPTPSATLVGSNNLLSGNPLLAPLGNYGGPTQTMPPLTTSPAIDAGGTTTLTTDQRGLPRDAKPDIGAVEYQGTRNLAAPILDPAGDATLSFGTPRNTPGFAWVLSRSPDLSPGSYNEIYRYQGGADIAAPGTTFVRTAAFITVTDGNAPAGNGYYRIGLVPVP